MNRFFVALGVVLALIGFCFVCSAIACYSGYTRACVIDLMPIEGNTVICERNHRKIRP